MIYAFKVFTDQQVSYTSWFLDAFNYAIFLGVDILNLSIGGPDYLDKPFVEKIRELISNNIVIVSAVGNSGPHYGTLMNPADDPAVIGVGGITKSHDIARFSSRGMTTWEIHDGLGYGRVKPDVMMYSENLVGSAIMTGCRRLSGTSVASPIIAGAAALLISALPSSRRHSYSSILVKQVLIDSSQRLKGSNIFESGAGLPDLEDALDMLLLSHKQGVITTYPESLNFSLKDCPYFWPYVFSRSCVHISFFSFECAFLSLSLDVVALSISLTYTHYTAHTHTHTHTPVRLASLDSLDTHTTSRYCRQPIYKGAMPVVANVTVLNSANSMGHIKSSPIWIPDSDNKYDDVLDIQTKYSSIIWPWGGHVSIFIRVRDSFTSSSSSIFVVSGSIVFSVSSRSNSNDDEETIITVRIPLRISVMPKVPPRYRRLLFDVSHSIQYPPGHIPRDDLSEEDDVLDWRGDHPHTNFRNIFDTLLSAGFFVEILYGDWTCFDANQYGAMFLIDSEDMNSRRERRKLQCDVSSHGLGLVVVGEWYNEKAQADAAFYDDNTKRWWEASTSGANVPALNCLLAPFEMAFSNRIYSGKFHVGTKNVPYASGTTIARFPKGGRLLFVDTLVDETEGVRNIGVLDRLRSSSKTSVPVLGLLSSEEEEEESAKSTRGNIALFGDSQCLDTVGSGKSCEWLVRLFARFAARVPRDELVSYSNVDTDMETQTQLSNALTEKFDALYTNGLDVPMRLSPEHHSRLAKVSTIQSWNPNENEIHFWDCDVSVQCTVPFSRNGVCT